jgi:hypothetical protein
MKEIKKKNETKLGTKPPSARSLATPVQAQTPSSSTSCPTSKSLLATEKRNLKLHGRPILVTVASLGFL